MEGVERRVAREANGSLVSPFSAGTWGLEEVTAFFGNLDMAEIVPIKCAFQAKFSRGGVLNLAVLVLVVVSIVFIHAIKYCDCVVFLSLFCSSD